MLRRGGFSYVFLLGSLLLVGKIRQCGLELVDDVLVVGFGNGVLDGLGL
jgi:hypothetical protein